MLRDQLKRHLDHDPHFTWRGENVTRVENLSDIVFAIAFGMLVSASSAPTNFSELIHHLVNIVPVSAGFITMVKIWNTHYVFFRRYGLADNRIIGLNCALLFLVLFIAYPLRFIFDALFSFILGAITRDWSRMTENGMDFYASADTMGFFAVGYSAIFTVVALMYSHALSKAEMLELSSAEITLTKRTVWSHWGEVGIGLVVFVSAMFTPIGPFAGFLLLLEWPLPIIVRNALPFDDTSKK